MERMRQNSSKTPKVGVKIRSFFLFRLASGRSSFRSVVLPIIDWAQKEMRVEIETCSYFTCFRLIPLFKFCESERKQPFQRMKRFWKLSSSKVLQLALFAGKIIETSL